jgi:hypothetical protein
MDDSDFAEPLAGDEAGTGNVGAAAPSNETGPDAMAGDDEWDDAEVLEENGAADDTAGLAGGVKRASSPPEETVPKRLCMVCCSRCSGDGLLP